MRRGEIVLLSFPFSSGGGSKVRPAVVVQCDSNNHRLQNTIVAMVTTSTHLAKVEPTQFLIDPKTPEGGPTGLLHPSAVKCENLFTVVQSVVIRTIGTLHPSHLIRLNACLKASLQLQ
jgi:mRNA-degrading endonuclease toxin of MazEF toxin-antitoxin module